MLTTTAVESATAYIFTVTDGTENNVFVYEWSKLLSQGQTKTQYLQSCKREAELLAAWEIQQRQPPTELVI